jgi:zinc transporter ZupT
MQRPQERADAKGRRPWRRTVLLGVLATGFHLVVGAWVGAAAYTAGSPRFDRGDLVPGPLEQGLDIAYDVLMSPLVGIVQGLEVMPRNRLLGVGLGVLNSALWGFAAVFLYSWIRRKRA